jgi:hypothetical protein
MNSAPVGSREPLARVNIQGNIVVTTKTATIRMRRLSTTELGQIFSHAKEQGSAQLRFDDEPWTLRRNSDHTFTLTPGHDHRASL